MKFKLAEAFVSLTAQDGGLDSSLAKAKSKVTGLHSSLTKLATTAVAFGAMATAFNSSAKAAGAMQAQMSRLNFELSGSTPEVFTTLEEEIKTLSKSFGISIDEIVNTFKEFSSSGNTSGDTFKLITAGAEAAVGGYTSLGTAVGNLDGILDAYGMSVSEVSVVSDMLFQSVKDGEGNFETLSGIISKVAPSAKAAKVSLSELMAVVTTLSSNVDPDRAANSLNSLFRVLNKSEEQEGRLSESKEDENTRNRLRESVATKGLIETLKTLATTKDRDVATMFSQKGLYENLAILLRDISKAESAHGALLKSKGTTNKAVSAATNNYEFALNKARISLSLLADTFGKEFLPVLTDGVNKVSAFADSVALWAKEHPQLISNLSKLGVAVTGTVVAVGGLGLALPVVATGLGMLLSPLALVTSAIVGIGGAMFVLRKDSVLLSNGFADVISTVQENFKGWFDWTVSWASAFVGALAVIPESLDVTFIKIENLFLNLRDRAVWAANNAKEAWVLAAAGVADAVESITGINPEKDNAQGEFALLKLQARAKLAFKETFFGIGAEQAREELETIKRLERKDPLVNGTLPRVKALDTFVPIDRSNRVTEAEARLAKAQEDVAKKLTTLLLPPVSKPVKLPTTDEPQGSILPPENTGGSLLPEKVGKSFAEFIGTPELNKRLQLAAIGATTEGQKQTAAIREQTRVLQKGVEYQKKTAENTSNLPNFDNTVGE